MAHAGEILGNRVTGEQLTFLATSRGTGGELTRIDWRLKPGGYGVHAFVEFQTALHTESLFGLARYGKTSIKAIPHPLQVIALLDEYEEELCLPLVPL